MLEQKLNELEQSDIYPFHMPGHKRAFLPFANPYAIDITEIEGFDNLHHATGILQEAQQKAADLYGAKKTYYLVNGSTCGLLAAISAAVPRGGKILVARNCHKARRPGPAYGRWRSWRHCADTGRTGGLPDGR